MINLGWNSVGRIGLADYRKARWRHFAFCLIPVGLYIGAAVGATQLPVWAPITLISIATVLLFYYRYRFMQVMVRRMHDRNISGILLLLSPILLVAVIGGALAFVTATVVGNGELPAWLDKGSSLSWMVVIPFLLFNIFLRYQLSQQGTPGPNRYGPPPGMGQTQVF